MAWTKVKLGEHGDRVTMTLSEEIPVGTSKELTISDVGSAGFFEVTLVRIEAQTDLFAPGNRAFVLQILDSSDDVLHEIAIDSNVIPSNTSKTWELYRNAPTAITTPQYVHLPPDTYIFSGQKLLVEDSAHVHFLDAMIVHVTGTAYYAKAV